MAEEKLKTGSYETEVKFKIEDLKKIKERLIHLGAEPKGETFEENLCFDTPEKRFYNHDQLMRLRRDKTGITLTFKGAKEFHGKIKKREEIEVKIGDFDKTKIILERLGLNVARIYEKKRETFAYNQTEIVFDKVPFIGDHLEIEGPEEKILETIKLLGLEEEEALNYTYGQLAEEWFKKGYQLTFEEEKKYKNGR